MIKYKQIKRFYKKIKKNAMFYKIILNTPKIK